MKKILMAGLTVGVLAFGSVAWADVVGSWKSLGYINDPNPMPAGASWIETYNPDGTYHIDVVVPGDADCFHDGTYSVNGSTLTLHADTITCADQQGLGVDFSRYFMIAGPTLVTQEVVGGSEGQQVELYEQYPALPSTTPGWNLIGTKNGKPLDVIELGDITSVWKWATVNNSKTWAVNLPGMQDKGAAYASSKGFGQFTTVEPGEGFWVNVPDTSTTTTTTMSTSETTTTTQVAYSGDTVMWKGQEWQRVGSDKGMTRDKAKEYCQALDEGGHSDWVLPTIGQLADLIVCNNGNYVKGEPSDWSFYKVCEYLNTWPYSKPTIDPAFTLVASNYWSSSSIGVNQGSTQVVDFYQGTIMSGPPADSSALYAICVRGGQETSISTTTTTQETTTTMAPTTTTTTTTTASELTTTTTLPATYTDNGDGTVTDNSTAVIWQKSGSDTDMNWDDAKAYCANLTDGGHDDWSLPDSAVLSSLVFCSNGTKVTGSTYYSFAGSTWVTFHPYSCGDNNETPFSAPTINPIFNSKSFGYWSSSMAYSPVASFRVDFGDGFVGGAYTSGLRYVRCIRNNN